MEKPYIIISTAMSIDGKIGTESRDPIQLSDEEDFLAVDKLRSECDAILVGSKTLKNDNPSLVLKTVKSKDPIKVAISSDLDIDLNCNFLQKGDSEKIIFTTSKADEKKVEGVREFAEVIVVKEDLVDVKELVAILYERGVKKLLVEGGGETNYLFLTKDLVDELRVAIAPVLVGGRGSPTLVDGEGFSLPKKFSLKDKKMVGNTLVLSYTK